MSNALCLFLSLAAGHDNMAQSVARTGYVYWAVLAKGLASP